MIGKFETLFTHYLSILKKSIYYRFYKIDITVYSKNIILKIVSSSNIDHFQDLIKIFKIPFSFVWPAKMYQQL